MCAWMKFGMKEMGGTGEQPKYKFVFWKADKRPKKML